MRLRYNPFTAIMAPEGAENAGAAAADTGAQSNYAPIREGGQALSLESAGEALGGLNLFGDEPTNPPADNADDQTGGDAGESDDQTGGDDDPTHTGDDDAESGETDSTDVENDDDQAAQDDGEQEPIETLSDLVGALEADPEFLEQLTDTFRADGEEVTVSLSELRKGYQRDANYRRQTQELADTRRAHEDEHRQSIANVQRELVVVGQVLQQGENLLLGELNTAEMQSLRTTNTAEWVARNEEIGQRIQGIRQLYSNASQQYDTYHTQQSEQSTQETEELRRKELENLQLAIPEWDDQLRGDIAGYLGTSYGYTADDLNGVMDSRMIVLANKARLYDQMQKLGTLTKKKVVNVPKSTKPGKGTPSPARQKNANVTNAKKRLKSSGKVRDAADLIGLAIQDL